VRRETTPGNHAATQDQASPPRSGLQGTAPRLSRADVEHRPRRNIMRCRANHKRRWSRSRRLFARGRKKPPSPHGANTACTA
jgi:hypothetical protein